MLSIQETTQACLDNFCVSDHLALRPARKKRERLYLRGVWSHDFKGTDEKGSKVLPVSYLRQNSNKVGINTAVNFLGPKLFLSVALCSASGNQDLFSTLIHIVTTSSHEVLSLIHI